MSTFMYTLLFEVLSHSRSQFTLDGQLLTRKAAIFPDEHMNEDELRAAYAPLRSNRGGRTSTNGLVAVVAAIKHDDYNHRVPHKRSERRYAYPKLAEALKDFGVRTNTRVPGSSAKRYVELGRRLRAVREKNLEKL
jgi:hypothetical protein